MKNAMPRIQNLNRFTGITWALNPRGPAPGSANHSPASPNVRIVQIIPCRNSRIDSRLIFLSFWLHRSLIALVLKLHHQADYTDDYRR